MFLKFFPLIALVCTSAIAQTSPSVPVKIEAPEKKEEIKIRQILTRSKVLVIQIPQWDVVSPQDIFVVSLSDDTQCDLAVQGVNAVLVNLDMSNCAKANLITLKSPVEKSLATSAPVSVAQVQKSVPEAVAPNEKLAATESIPVNTSVSDLSNEARRPHFSFGVNLSSMNSFYFSNVRVKDNSGGTISTDSAKFKTDMGTGINASVLLWGSHSWGFSLGGFYEFARDVDSVTSGGSTSNYNNLKITVYGAEANMIYRWGRWYLPFGFNYSMMDPENHVGTLTVTAGLGTQVGAGFMVSKHHSFELMAKLVSFTVEEYDSTYSANYGTGYGSGLNGSWRFIF